MATRLNTRQADTVREHIKSTKIVQRLQCFIHGEAMGRSKEPVIMSATQVNAALGLLRKTVPDLNQVDLFGEIEHVNDAKNLTDQELERIAAGGGRGTAIKAKSKK